MRFLAVVLVVCVALLLFHNYAMASLDRQIEEQFAQADFNYNYSEHRWCVNAQWRDAPPGDYVGTCKPTLREAEISLLEQPNTKVVEK